LAISLRRLEGVQKALQSPILDGFKGSMISQMIAAWPRKTDHVQPGQIAPEGWAVQRLAGVPALPVCLAAGGSLAASGAVARWRGLLAGLQAANRPL